MKKFNEFLSEGKKLTLKRKYTERHPARTVGKTASVRNSVIEAIKDGVITKEEFTKIISELSGDHKQWKSRNKKYFNVSEDGVSLSRWGIKILGELNKTSKSKELNEYGPMAGSDNRNYSVNALVDRIGDLDSILMYDRKAENEWEQISQNYLDGERGSEYWADLGDQELQDAIDDAESLMKKYRIKESVVTEAKFRVGDKVSILSRSSKKPFDSGEVTRIQKDGMIVVNGLKTFSSEIAIDADSLVKESVVTEAKFVKDFDKGVLDAETKADITTYYPSAKFFMGKMTHFFGELEPNLFFKAYYAKYYKKDTGKKIDGEFKITSIYSEKGRNYVNLYTESADNVREGNAFLGARAKAIEEGSEEFEFDGKTYKVTNKNTKKMNNKFLHESFASFINSSSKSINEAKFKKGQKIKTTVHSDDFDGDVYDITNDVDGSTLNKDAEFKIWDISKYEVVLRSDEDDVEYSIDPDDLKNFVKESVVTEAKAKKLTFKDIEKAWDLSYGEDFEYEYGSIYVEIMDKYKGKVTKYELAEIWDEKYGEDLQSEHFDFFDRLDEKLCEATVIMDATDPESKGLKKLLKKHKVELKVLREIGPAGGHPEVELTGKRKDIEAVLADSKYGWDDDGHLASFIEESATTESEYNVLNEKISSAILSGILQSNQEGKHARKNVARLAGGFYQLTKVALDKIQDEDFILDNNPQKAFKNHGGSKNIIFFISDNEKENPYLPQDSRSYNAMSTIPGGGCLLAAMGGDREFYTNDWSRWAKTTSWKKDGRKGSADQVGVNKKYRGWGASGLSNGKRIAEVSDRVIIVSLDLIRQKYSTENLRGDRARAKEGATAFTDDAAFKKANADRYHQILATKAASLPIDKMVEQAIDELAEQIKAGLSSGNKTRYDEIKIGENSKGREAKLRDASNHMSNILDNYSRYCDYIRQGEESEERYGQSESYYEREAKNYAKTIKDQISKIETFDYAW